MFVLFLASKGSFLSPKSSLPQMHTEFSNRSLARVPPLTPLMGVFFLAFGSLPHPDDLTLLFAAEYLPLMFQVVLPGF